MKKCELPGHTRVVYSTGKSDCYECRTVSRRRRESCPKFKEQKRAKWQTNYNSAEWKQKRAVARAKRLYKIDEIPQGTCAMCQEKPARVTDHDHKTGAFRGFLCVICNVRLGVLESETINKQATAYLEMVKEKLKNGK